MADPITKLEVTVVSAAASGADTSVLHGLAAFDGFASFGVQYAIFGLWDHDPGTGAVRSSYYAAALAPWDLSNTTGYGTGNPNDPSSWPVILNTTLGGVYDVVLADGGTSYLAGGTFAIEKSFDLGHYTFSYPGGTFVVPINQVFVTSGDHTSAGSLLPGSNPAASGTSGVCHTIAIGPGGTVGSETEQWKDFYYSVSGSHVLGATMGSVDPGLWVSNYTHSESFGAPPATHSDTQLTAAYQTHLFTTTIHGGVFGQDYREWRGPSDFAPMDMTHVREHGPLYVALIYQADPTVVKFRQSYDNGTTWAESTLFPPPGFFGGGSTTNTSPSIIWLKGRIYAVWYNGSAIVQSVSPDLGVSWSNPLTLSITGTNPRVIVDQRHGTAFYFSINGSGTLMLQRSGNFGTDWIDASPITVATGVGIQTVTAQVASDGTLVVGYIISGAWTQLRSRDNGVSWA